MMILGMLDYLTNLSERHIRQAFAVFSALAYSPQGDQTLHDEVDMTNHRVSDEIVDSDYDTQAAVELHS